MEIALIIIFSVLFVAGVVYVIHTNIKERKLIEQVTPINRGEWSERRSVLPLLRLGINPRAIFHDLYIKKADGNYSQIDLVAPTKVGIIVFEIKDYSGWIFGDESQKYWTQILAYGKEKHRFYNPIIQNAGHINALKECLTENPDIPFYSVIVFYGNSILKKVSFNSENTFLIYPGQIESTVAKILENEPAKYGNKYEIMNVLTQAVRNGTHSEIRHSQIGYASKCNKKAPVSERKSISYNTPHISDYLKYNRRYFTRNYKFRLKKWL